ncbi:MAG: DUF4173 domain-containing protein [Ruminococcaceae bacterium]|nr:DUF4173 domain-containing protein [Oscillospiraceae bacterium]
METNTNYTPVNVVPYKPKPLFELTKSDTAFSVCAVIISIIYSIFGIFGGFSLGYLISNVFLIFMFAFYFKRQSKPQFFSTLCGLLALGINAVFITTTNGSVRFFSCLISFLLTLLCFDNFINGTSKGNRKTVGIFYSALSTTGNIAVSLKSLFSSKNGNKQNLGKVLVGIVCAIPVLLVVVPLLISSDDAFRGMMTNIFKNTFSTIIKAIFGLIFSLFVISYGFSLKNKRVSKIEKAKFGGIENVYIISFLSAIGVCYLLYLFSQLAYFFSAFSGFLPKGQITYAGYARKGFFEMCVIAVINLILVFISLLISKKQKGKACIPIKILTTFISIFTLIIITTAISKMVLYINAYGMTVLRLTTSAFMLFLSIVFISIILRIYITKINIIKTALITAGCIILVLGVVNVNSVCAKYNYESYINGKLKTIDVNALYNLGDEGIPYIIKLTKSKDAEILQTSEEYLTQAYLFDYFDNMLDIKDYTLKELKQNQRYNGFSYFSLPKSKAYNQLYKFAQENPDFISSHKPIYENRNCEEI